MTSAEIMIGVVIAFMLIIALGVAIRAVLAFALWVADGFDECVEDIARSLFKK